MVFKEVFEYGANRRKNQALLNPKKAAPWKLGLGFNNHLALLVHEDQRLEARQKKLLSSQAKKLSKKEQADEAARNARSPVKRREAGKSRSIYPGAIGVSPSFLSTMKSRVQDEKQHKRQARHGILAERGMLRCASDIGASTIAPCGSDLGQESSTKGFYSGSAALNATLASPASPGHSKTVGWAPLEPVTEDRAAGSEAAAVADSKVPVAGDCTLSDPAAIAEAAVGVNSKKMPNAEPGQVRVNVAEGAVVEGVAVGCWIGGEPSSPMSNASVRRCDGCVSSRSAALASLTLALCLLALRSHSTISPYPPAASSYCSAQITVARFGKC